MSGQLTMLELPDDDVVSVELVLDPAETGRSCGIGISDLVIRVETWTPTASGRRASKLPSPSHLMVQRTSWPPGSWIPDGNRIELVQWSSGHPDGITAGDWSYGNGAGRLLRRM
jgi:lactoylglutathione lyase